jgi:large subunit ribosomal protein L22
MKRIRPAPMGRAFRYQRRLTHIVLSVAERGVSKSLVTKVEEPVAETKTPKGKATKAPKATAAKTTKPKAAAKTAGTTKKKASKTA